MLNKILPLITLSVLALTSCGGTTTPAVASESAVSGVVSSRTFDAGDQTMSKEETQILAELNTVRATGRYCGADFYPAAPALTWNGYLAAAGRSHNLDMATNNFFGHVSPTGSTIQGRIEAAGYTSWKTIGENIAAGSTLSGVTQDWLNSTGHCKNIMNPDYKEVGISYVYRSGTQYGTYWAQEFGTR